MNEYTIIGGGIIGMLTAFNLMEAGVDVTLIDRGELGRESSWAGGGICSPLYPWSEDRALSALFAQSQKVYPNLAQRLKETTGIDPEWTVSGVLNLDIHESDAALRWGQQHAATISLCASAQLAKIQPGLNANIGQALWLPDIAQIRNSRLIAALRRYLLSQPQVNVIEQCAVREIIVKQGQVKGVSISNGNLISKHIIIAAGSWSGELLSPLGVTLDVFPVKGQMITIQAPPDLLRRIILRGDQYLIPRQDGLILVGSTLEYTGFDKTTLPMVRTELYQLAVDILPPLAHYPVVHHWAGLRPGTSGDAPIIGPVPSIKGLYLNTGHFRNGLGLAPASAKVLVDSLLG